MTSDGRVLCVLSEESDKSRQISEMDGRLVGWQGKARHSSINKAWTRQARRSRNDDSNKKQGHCSCFNSFSSFNIINTIVSKLELELEREEEEIIMMHKSNLELK